MAPSPVFPVGALRALFLAAWIVVPGILSGVSCGRVLLQGPSGDGPIPDPPILAKWVQPLTRPPKIMTFDPESLAQTNAKITLGEYVKTAVLHPDLPPTAAWAYGESAKRATVPGPTIEVLQAQCLDVTFVNHLPGTHLLEGSLDRTLLYQAPPDGHGVPTSVHLHGGVTEPQSDGHPDTWITNAAVCDYTAPQPNFCTGPLFNASNRFGDPPGQKTHHYANINDATMLWYHDHAFGQTRLNVYPGLFGAYFVRSKWELRNEALPRGSYEVEMLISDYNISADGSLQYPTDSGIKEHPNWVPEVYGQHMTVNGRVWPFHPVQQAKYRFRIVNVAQARFLNLNLTVLPAGADGSIDETGNLPFLQIGADQGFLSAPAPLVSILMGPAERADVIVDFSGLAPGTEVILANYAQTPYPGGDLADLTIDEQQILKFIVTLGNDQGPLPEFVPPSVPEYMPAEPALVRMGPVNRHQILNETEDVKGNPTGQLLNYLPFRDKNTGHLIVTERPAVGSTEEWVFVNPTVDSHPMHIHLIGVKVISRRPYDPPTSTLPNLNFTGPEEDPLPNETGYKDTVTCPPSYVTRVRITWRRPHTSGPGVAPFPFDATASPGYVWHCHIVTHEDNEMMRPFFLVNHTHSAYV